MKILVLANQDLASNVALNLLLPKLSQQHQLLVWLSPKVGDNKKSLPQLQQLGFLEQDNFNQIITPTLNQRQPAKYKTFRQLEYFLCASPELVANINAPERLEQLNALKPDLMISIRFGQILKQAVIESTRLPVLNLHSGLLPQYRGVMATFWAMLNDEKEIGTCLHTIDDEGIDSGSIIAHTYQPMDRSKSYLEQVLALYPEGVSNIIDAVDKLATGKPIPRIQAEPNDTYYSFPHVSDFQQFDQKGLKLVDNDQYCKFINQFYLED